MPPVLEPTVTLAAPDPGFAETDAVAIDGDYAVVAYRKEDFDPESDQFTFDRLPVIYHRNSSRAWQVLQTLPIVPDGGQSAEPGFLAIRGNIIAYAVTGRLFVYERDGSGWQESPIAPNAVLARPYDVDIDNGTIVVGAMTCGHAEAQAYRKNTSGTWVRVGTASSAPTTSICYRRTDIGTAISGNTTILAVAQLADGTGVVYFFNGAPSTWSAPALTVNYPDGGGTPVASSGDLAIIAGSQLYRRSGGVWTFKENLQRAEYGTGASAASLRGNLAALYFDQWISLFQVSTSANALEIARLTAPGNVQGINQLDISGRRVITNAVQWQGDVPNIGKAFIFEVPATLPTQPMPIQETFQSGNAAHWTPLAGGSWSVAATTASLVYRQASLAGDATSISSNSDWSNQSVQADVRPTAFSGNDRWFGLAVRRVDAANYYYVTARSSGVVQLKKMVNGVFQTLASVDLPISAGADYRLRLEAIGTTLRVYVNGIEQLQAFDASLSHGQAALMTYKASTDFDNVIVSPSPQTTLFTDEFSHSRAWTPVAGQWSRTPYPNEARVQSSTAGGASAYTGNSNTDQSIHARVRETAVGTGTQPWFGLFARYRDPNNYYYVTVRNSNEISLRRLVNGTTQVLDSAPFNVSVGNWYELRLEAIQDQVRVYVGNRLMLEATDAALSEGRFGAVMYKAAAYYDDVIVTQP